MVSDENSKPENYDWKSCVGAPMIQTLKRPRSWLSYRTNNPMRKLPLILNTDFNRRLACTNCFGYKRQNKILNKIAIALLQNRYQLLWAYKNKFRTCSDMNFQLHSFAPLSTCADGDLYLGLQFVCCPNGEYLTSIIAIGPQYEKLKSVLW